MKLDHTHSINPLCALAHIKSLVVLISDVIHMHQMNEVRSYYICIFLCPPKLLRAYHIFLIKYYVHHEYYSCYWWPGWYSKLAWEEFPCLPSNHA